MMESELIQNLTQLRTLYAETGASTPQLVNDYAWLIVKALNHEYEHLGSQACRQLLADCLRLPLERPSRVHSALLAASLRVHAAYPEFRFAAFLRLWNTSNFQPEDLLPYSKDGKMCRSLVERVARSYVRSLVFYPDDKLPEEQLPILRNTVENSGLLMPVKMVVTKMTVSEVRGRKMRFVNLSSPDGLEVSCESHALHPSPLAASASPLAASASHVVQSAQPGAYGAPRHYVSVGQLYDVMLSRSKNATPSDSRLRSYRVQEGYLSSTPISDVFPLVTGYVAGADRSRNTLHVYDALSRHFVASVDRFSREKVGDFVRFLPIVPADHAFKSAVIMAGGDSVAATSFPAKQIRVVSVNHQKGYLSWELLNATDAIVETLSPFQQQRGEVSPSFIRGFMSFPRPAGTEAPTIPYSVGDVLNAIIFLRRGQDGQKRPFVAKVVE